MCSCCCYDNTKKILFAGKTHPVNGFSWKWKCVSRKGREDWIVISVSWLWVMYSCLRFGTSSKKPENVQKGFSRRWNSFQECTNSKSFTGDRGYLAGWTVCEKQQSKPGRNVEILLWCNSSLLSRYRAQESIGNSSRALSLMSNRSIADQFPSKSTMFKFSLCSLFEQGRGTSW